jgi:hypothetical protein
MTAKELCKTGKLDEQVETLAEAVLAMQKKIKDQTGIYDKMPLAQQVTIGTGDVQLRANPAVVEYRATVRDYAAALNSLRNILDETGSSEGAPISQIETLRQKYKIS